jgi:hypothetical protein
MEMEKIKNGLPASKPLQRNRTTGALILNVAFLYFSYTLEPFVPALCNYNKVESKIKVHKELLLLTELRLLSVGLSSLGCSKPLSSSRRSIVSTRRLDPWSLFATYICGVPTPEQRRDILIVS